MVGLGVTAACANPRGHPPYPTSTFAFTANSLVPSPGSGDSLLFGIRGRFEGSAQVRGGTIEIVVPRGIVVVSYDEPAESRTLRLRAALGTGSRGDAWDLTARSRDVNLWRTLGLTEAGPFDETERTISDTLRFTIAVPAELDLRRAWLVFEFEWPTAYQGRRTVATTYAHTDTLLFATLPPSAGR